MELQLLNSQSVLTQSDLNQDQLQCFNTKIDVKSQELKGKVYLCFYSSITNAITTNQRLMNIPIDDKSITRQYQVKQEIIFSQINELEVHSLREFLQKGKKMNLNVQIDEDEFLQLLQIMFSACDQKKIQKENTQFKFELTLTGGPGDFGIILKKGNSSLYIILIQESRESNLMTQTQIKFRPTVKNNNYQLASYIASDSHYKGGYQGILCDNQGYLLEASMATIGTLLKNGDFVIPPFERILQGTTAVKILNFLEQQIFPNMESKYEKILGKDYIKRIVRREISIQEAQNESVEVLYFGGEECVPLLEWDNIKLRQNKGPLAQLFQDYFSEINKNVQLNNLTEVSSNVPSIILTQIQE